ncbi:MAG: hypothetical protein ACR2K5_16825, partial [Pseudolabrys sp.]
GLERSLVRGEEVEGGDIVLQELRKTLRASREAAPRYGNAARLFFEPVEPFLVDDGGERDHPGRITRASLDALWTWIRRDLLPDEAKTYSEEVVRVLQAEKTLDAQFLAHGFQDRASVAIGAALADARDDRAHRRLIAQIGTPRAQDDAVCLMRVLQSRDALATMAAHLPGLIPDLSGVKLDQAKALIDLMSDRVRDAFPYALLSVMNRLVMPWQLIRLATKAAGGDSIKRIAQTPYALAVTIVLSELGRMARELRDDLKAGGCVGVGALLKIIHDTARGLRTELDLPADSAWGRELAELRSQISDILKSEIEAMPGRVRRLLRPRPSSEIRANSVLDAGDVAETEALIDFVGACRHYAAELALNEISQRCYSNLQHDLDGGSGALLDALRHSGDNDRSFRLSQLDALARFCGKVFGADYAAMLNKAAEVAAAPDSRGPRAA